MINIAIIGGGFYGCEIAIFLRRFFKEIIVIEREKDLLQRASYVNQARVHNGYHYPRSYLTALRSHQNFDPFIKDYKFAIDDKFIKIYVIAKLNSKVSSFEFENFTKRIGIPLGPAPEKIINLFNPFYIDKVYLTKEVAFDAVKLKNYLKKKLKTLGIKIIFQKEVQKIKKLKDQIKVIFTDKTSVVADFVFNCTYSRINTILYNSNLPLLPLKHEIIEMALVKPPKILKNLGITVMDGPFFSIMPFPAKNYHSFSHVRYTPLTKWSDQEEYHDPYKVFSKYPLKSKFLFMLKDATRYLPVLSKLEYVKSLYEVKTVLVETESNDGRPILFRKDYGGIKNFFLILGGKIDNIYDIKNKLEKEFD